MIAAAAILPLLKKSWPYIAAIAAAGVVLWFTYNAGANHTADRLNAQYQTELAERQKALADALLAERAESERKLAMVQDAARTNQEALQAQADTYKSITERLNDYVQTNLSIRDCGLDADGLRIWNDANAGRDSVGQPVH